MLSLDHATRFADVALGHVGREYPQKLDQVLTGPEDLQPPRALHPVFFGSFDWHSCVHAWWMLARLLRRHPGAAWAEDIRALFRSTLTPENVAAELAYLDRPLTATFERPYGWAWLLMLAAELSRLGGDEARSWSTTLSPLAEAFARRFLTWLPKATYPNRSGVHANTAFALVLAVEYAAVAGDRTLGAAASEAARRWYQPDADCQAWEPSGEDFLSPCLMEAVCMLRMLPAEEFRLWFARFLPRVVQGQPAALFEPASVSDRSDGRIAHLDGLNLSRSWCWNALAAALSGDDPRRAMMQDAARRHLQASLPHVSGDYMGEHWLASFATLALEAG